MYADQIVIRGAKEHNLRNINVTLPRNRLVVLTGVSGSGKSSLAFDTLYAEGQRRYVESLSSYARQFLDQMEKPKVDYISGLSPAIAIEQKALSRNPRSTVATVTEIYDYMRVLYARAGTPHCPQCGREVRAQSAQEIVEQIAALPAGERFQLLAPLARNRKGAFQDLLAELTADGFARVRLDGAVRELDAAHRNAAAQPPINKKLKHNLELVVDRLIVPADDADDAARDAFLSRLTDSVETALARSEAADENATLIVVRERRQGTDASAQGTDASAQSTDASAQSTDALAQSTEPRDQGTDEKMVQYEEITLSAENACPECNLSFPELSPAMFSFNSPLGMCPTCNGLGTKVEFDPALFVDPEKSLMDGAMVAWGELHKKKGAGAYMMAEQITAQHGCTLDTPWKDLPEACRHAFLFGGARVVWQWQNARSSGRHEATNEGEVNSVRRRYNQTKSEGMRRWYMRFMSHQPCPTCRGLRLRPESAAVTVGGRTICEATSLSIGRCLDWVRGLYRREALEGALSDEQMEIAEEILKEIHERLQFLVNVGLDYITLDRPAGTLSGGEGQRIRLASQVGCGLVGVLYVLDEPSIGLHQRDNRRLLDTLEHLRDMGNTVIVVEHDEETMRSADYIVDLGPGAGVGGGKVVSAGSPEAIMADARSLTGRYLTGELAVTSPTGRRRPTNGHWLTVVGAREHNLRALDVRFPLGLFTCVTGVSGSGKSSLVAQTLFPALGRVLHNADKRPGAHDRIEGLEQVSKVINITQDPIGRTPRSNPATYSQVMGHIRDLFALTAEARLRGYQAGRFSFNQKGGRCEACKGHGKKCVEMHFLPDVWVTCAVCKGTRFNRETLQIRYKGKSIADVLDMDVDEALGFFGDIPSIARILRTLADVGLGYIKLGQSATTLSGGEAQRVKLAKELARVSTGDTVYILDEPTTGLHFADIQKLLDVLHLLTDAGNTVIVVEHNLDVIKTADWIIDLGPEGGDAGGCIVAQGTPEEVAAMAESHTGRFLRRVLAGMKEMPTGAPGDNGHIAAG